MLLLFGRHSGGEDGLVGGQPARQGEEPFGADDGCLEVDAVDRQEVGVQVVGVVGDPGIVG
jgi:hypothetical protein